MKRKVTDAQRVTFSARRPDPSCGIEALTLGRKTKPPSTSWWISKDFKAAHDRELPRILKSTTRSLASREGEPVRP